MTGHLAPWPLQHLDVADARKAGHKPVPFQQFILKIHSRCNLACTYCYVYEMADQGWREMPRLMSPAVTEMAAKRIDEHVQRAPPVRASTSSCTAVSRCWPGRGGSPS